MKSAATRLLLSCLLAALAACSSGPVVAPGERLVSLPGGQKIVAEVAATQESMARGMMYRDSLAPDRGMLFLHSSPSRTPYWMHNCKIALDIIWMDASRRVVEISANTPPCEKEAKDCPNYGGNEVSMFVLELASGMAAKYGITIGTVIDF